MAILTHTATGGAFDDEIGDDLAPAGTHLARVIGIKDAMGVERRKYQSEEHEIVDLTTFLFGFRDAAGKAHKIATRPMKITGHPKSALMAFLTALMGRQPEMGYDYCCLRGYDCVVTVAHEPRADGGGVYPRVVSCSPRPYPQAAAPAAPAPVKAAAPAPAPVAAPALVSTDDDPIPF